MRRVLFALAGLLLFAASAAAQQNQIPFWLPTYIPLSGTSSSVASNTTDYTCPGNTGTSLKTGCPVTAQTGAIDHLTFYVAAAPGTGNTDTITLMVGTYNGMSATTVTCTIADTNTNCSDTTHSAAIVAGQLWTIRVVTSSSATATGVTSYGLRLRTP